MKIRLWNLYLHTRPFWRFLLCGVAHALSIAHHVKFLQVAIEHRTRSIKLHHLIPSVSLLWGNEVSFFFRKPPMILFFSLVSSSSCSSWWFQPIWKILVKLNWIISPNRDENKKYLKPPPSVLLKIPVRSHHGMLHSSADESSPSRTPFCGRKRSGRTCLSGTMVPCMTGKIPKKGSLSKYQRIPKVCTGQLLKSDFFMYLCCLETNCLKTLAHSTKMSIIPTSTRERVPYSSPLTWLPSFKMIWFAMGFGPTTRFDGRGSRRDLQRNATQRPSLAKEFLQRMKVQAKDHLSHGAPKCRDPGCVSTVPGSWNFHGFWWK